MLQASAASRAVEHAFRLRDSRLVLRGYFRFGFVRHPVDRFESCWRNKVVEQNHFGVEPAEQSAMAADINRFVSYVESLDLDSCDLHLRRQSRLLDLDVMDFVGRMETFDDDVVRVMRHLRLGPPASVERRNVSARPRVGGPRLSPSSRKRLESLYASDFENFGYERD